MSKKLGTPFLRQCFVTAAVCSNTISHGCVMGYPAILFPQLRQPGSSVSLTLTQESWIASVVSVTMCVGALLGGGAAARAGRRKAHAGAAAVGVISWTILLGAPQYEVMLLARILQGLSLGLHSPLRCMLIGEYSSPRHRGTFLSLVSLSLAGGVCIVHGVGAWLPWPHAALAGLSFSFLSLVLTLYSVESPSYLAAAGRYDESRAAFRWLRGYEEDDELDEMIRACALMRMGRTKEKRNKINEFFSLLKKKEFYKPVLLMAHLYLMMQVSGGLILSNYSTIIIEEVMGKNVNLNFWMIMLDVLRIVSSIAAVYIVNKLKRRTMLFSACALNVFSFLSIALYKYGKDKALLPFQSSMIPATLLSLHVLSVGGGMVPVPHVVSGEVYPLAARGVAGSVGVVPLTLYMFCTLHTFPPLMSGPGLALTYVLYAGIVSYCVVVSWRFLPETRGRTLAHVEAELRGKAPTVEEEEALTDPVLLYKRKMSLRRNSSVLF